MIQSTKSLSNVSTNQSKLAQTDIQIETKLSYNQLDWKKQRWIDISIELCTRNKSKIAKECSLRYGDAPITWRKNYYDWNRRLGFEDFWIEFYTKEKDKELRLHTTDRAISLVQNERDLSKVTELYKTVNPSSKETTQPSQTTNIFLDQIKNTYGI